MNIDLNTAEGRAEARRLGISVPDESTAEGTEANGGTQGLIFPGDEHTRQCYACQRRLPLKDFHSDKSQTGGMSYRCKTCDAIKGSRRPRRSGAGIVMGMHTYESLMEKQGHRCAICGSSNPSGIDPRRTRFSIDHDHSTGAVRGLLCINCNRALGLFRDDPAIISKALQYLAEATSGN